MISFWDGLGFLASIRQAFIIDVLGVKNERVFFFLGLDEKFGFPGDY